MNLNSRIDLRVPWNEKDQAKAFGARWDVKNRIWYAPAGTELQQLKRWLPDGVMEMTADVTPMVPKPDEKGISLTELLRRLKGVIEDGFPSAEWVRAEISELRGKNGNLYLTLAERNDKGDLLAQAKGVIWRTKAEQITAKFAETTGAGLKADIKILCLARVRFEPLYGLDLVIDDVDPYYTLGDLVAKLARIRAHLQQSGLYARNGQLPDPVEFVRVAVISPETSAGLGDFRQEADRLHMAGLCEFRFFPATFQGVEAPSSIQAAVLEALTEGKRKRFDALVIIRGGGAVTDLAWLNDLELAKLLCQSPIPVLTGIGHERDSTILDEIAHTRFDTPSKVALHIRNTIKENAVAAIQHCERITAAVGRIVHRERTILASQADRVETGARAVMSRVASDQEAFLKLIGMAVSAQIQVAGISLATERARVISEVEDTLVNTDAELAHLAQSITQRAQMQLEAERSDIARMMDTVSFSARSRLDAAGTEIDRVKMDIGRDSARMAATARDELDHAIGLIENRAMAMADGARKDIENFARIVVGMGPQSTLQRGFAILRDTADKPVTSREAAITLDTIEIELRDGRLKVKNHDRSGGDQR